jgi:hypothetical protein
MRAILLLLLASVTAGGCKTAEFAVDHSMTGIHVAAKFEAKDGDSPSSDGSDWNGGDQIATMRR